MLSYFVLFPLLMLGINTVPVIEGTPAGGSGSWYDRQEENEQQVGPDTATATAYGTANPTIPSNFDAREEWPQCAEVIGRIRDQAVCHSCWAVAAASVVSDRICIAKAKAGWPIVLEENLISEWDLISCVPKIFEEEDGSNGCANYPYTDNAYEYMKEYLVSGGLHGEEMGCKPYLLPITNTPASARIFYFPYTEPPKCVKKCRRGHPRSYEEEIEAKMGVKDARDKWPECAGIISTIRDQGGCASGWAVSVASVLTDRLCIAKAKQGQEIIPEKTFVSELDIISCTGGHNGCLWGINIDAWKFVLKNMVVTGSPSGIPEEFQFGCKPYHLEPKNIPFAEGPSGTAKRETPECVLECSNKKYSFEKSKKETGIKKITAVVVNPAEINVEWKFDWEGFEIYPTSNEDPLEIMQREIMENGSIQVTLDLPGDAIFQYGKGDDILKDSKNLKFYRQYVRLFGWGETEYGQQYWLGANSWGTAWGDGGFMKIPRGVNAFGVEGNPIVFPRIELELEVPIADSVIDWDIGTSTIGGSQDGKKQLKKKKKGKGRKKH